MPEQSESATPVSPDELPPRTSPLALGYRQLDPTRIVDTLEILRRRIGERFPQSGLGRVSDDLLSLARESSAHVAYLGNPNWPVRIGVAFVIVLMLAVVAFAVTGLRLPARVDDIGEFLQAVDSAVNDVVFLGIAIFFLVTIETRIKRRRALQVIHQLRSIAHVVDMHQLTKDPERLMSGEPDTQSSPVRSMSRPELGRYLDYCSELLSLTSKIAALLVQRFADPIVLGAVNEVETLTAGLSRKIWQKITLLDRAVR